MAINKTLGRGLDALLNTFKEEEIVSEAKTAGGGVASTNEIDISKIDVNPNQARKQFDEIPLRELAESIKERGIIQPLILIKRGDRYMIVAGERRFRAAKIAGITTVPAIIKELTTQQIMEISLIENLQREDLNPIEAAVGMKELMDAHNLSQEELARRIGMSRPTVTNTMRLLLLTPEVIQLVRENRLSAGHARALVTVTDKDAQIALANAASDGKRSVRDLEMDVKLYFNRKNIPTGPREKVIQSRELKGFVTDLKRVFGTRVKIKGNDEKGRIMIDYFTADDLQRIYEIIDIVKANVGTK